MKINVSEATPIQLNWMVAKAEGRPRTYLIGEDFADYQRDGLMCYSTNWSQGGLIIEREGICHSSVRQGMRIVGWRAAFKSDGKFAFESPTPLVAAMRCYVASKLGHEIELPEELC